MGLNFAQIERVARMSSPVAMDVASRTASSATRTTIVATSRMKRTAGTDRNAAPIPSLAPVAPAFPRNGSVTGKTTVTLERMRR